MNACVLTPGDAVAISAGRSLRIGVTVAAAPTKPAGWASARDGAGDADDAEASSGVSGGVITPSGTEARGGEEAGGSEDGAAPPSGQFAAVC